MSVLASVSDNQQQPPRHFKHKGQSRPIKFYVMTTVKVIKSKEFTTKEGVKATHYVCAYKGRVFGVSTLRFEPKDLEVKDNILTIKCDVEVLKHTSIDSLTGEVSNYLDIVPKCDIALAAF
jgi:hypothetical protein